MQMSRLGEGSPQATTMREGAGSMCSTAASCAVKEARILAGGWHCLCNGPRPRGSFGKGPKAPETIVLPRFSLADVGPPSLTPKATMALSYDTWTNEGRHVTERMRMQQTHIGYCVTKASRSAEIESKW